MSEVDDFIILGTSKDLLNMKGIKELIDYPQFLQEPLSQAFYFNFAFEEKNFALAIFFSYLRQALLEYDLKKLAKLSADLLKINCTKISQQINEILEDCQSLIKMTEESSWTGIIQILKKTETKEFISVWENEVQFRQEFESNGDVEHSMKQIDDFLFSSIQYVDWDLKKRKKSLKNCQTQNDDKIIYLLRTKDKLYIIMTNNTRLIQTQFKLQFLKYQAEESFSKTQDCLVKQNQEYIKVQEEKEEIEKKFQQLLKGQEETNTQKINKSEQVKNQNQLIDKVNLLTSHISSLERKISEKITQYNKLYFMNHQLVIENFEKNKEIQQLKESLLLKASENQKFNQEEEIEKNEQTNIVPIQIPSNIYEEDMEESIRKQSHLNDGTSQIQEIKNQKKGFFCCLRRRKQPKPNV